MASSRFPPRASDLIPGVVWRAASLAARLGFLVLIVPLTLPTQFGIFFSYSSLGILFGRILSFGAIDHLPTEVRGSTAAMLVTCRTVLPFSIFAVLITFYALNSSSLFLLSASLALSLASGLALAGAIRSVNASLFEQWMNVHPIVFVVIAFLHGDGLAANELLLFQSMSLLLGQTPLIFYIYRESRRRPPEASTQWLPRFKKLASGGLPKMISDTLLTGCIRGVALGPVLFGMAAISDALAIGLMLGEAALSIGMILVHRNFSFYCSVMPVREQSVGSAAFLLFGISIAGAIGASVSHTLSDKWLFNYVDPLLLVASFVFFAGITSLSEFRYFDLARNRALLPWITAQAVFIACTFGVVLSAVEPSITLFLFFSTSVPALISIVFRTFAQG